MARKTAARLATLRHGPNEEWIRSTPIKSATHPPRPMPEWKAVLRLHVPF